MLCAFVNGVAWVWCCLLSYRPCAFCSGVAWACRIYNIVESESDPLTRRPVDLFEKEPLKGKWEVNLHTPTKFGEDPSKDLGVHREQTKQTNKQTNKGCSNYSIVIIAFIVSGVSDQISTITSRYTTCCAVNVYIFVYIFIGAPIVPLKEGGVLGVIPMVHSNQSFSSLGWKICPQRKKMDRSSFWLRSKCRKTLWHCFSGP